MAQSFSAMLLSKKFTRNSVILGPSIHLPLCFIMREANLLSTSKTEVKNSAHRLLTRRSHPQPAPRFEEAVASVRVRHRQLDSSGASMLSTYYDMSATNDNNFATRSLNTGNELLAIRRNQRNGPLFDSSLPLKIVLNASDSILLRISASSEDNGHSVQLSALHLPKNAVFNTSTGFFQWKAVQGEDYFSAEARDTTNNLTSKHDINFQVAATSEGVISVRATGAGFHLSMVGLFMLAC